MKLRYLLILGVLVFLNGFVFTVLFLFVSREMARPAASLTPTGELQLPPTFTSTPVSPTPSNTPTPSPTATPQPAATNTFVVMIPSVTPTSIPGAPTATLTPGPPTETAGPVSPTPTSLPSSPTPTTTATATPTATLSTYQYESPGPWYENNCQTTWIEGTVWDLTSFPKAGVRVRCWTYGQVLGDKITPSDPGKSDGYYEFILHAQSGVPREVAVEVAIVDDSGNLLSPRIMAQTTATDCENANGRQRVVVDFVQLR